MVHKTNMNLQELTTAIKNKKAIIWDLDGVIVFANWYYGENFATWWERFWKLLEKYDPDVRNKFKKGLQHYFEHSNYIAANYGKTALAEINKYLLAKELMIYPFSTLNEDIIQLIKGLNPDLEQYIWSNNQETFILKVLLSAGIRNKFKGIVSRDKVTLAKPELEGFKIIQSLTSVAKKDFLIVGDSEKTDKLVAKKLNIDFFLYKDEKQIL